MNSGEVGSVAVRLGSAMKPGVGNELASTESVWETSSHHDNTMI